MPPKSLRIISVGALKIPHWKDASAHYTKRLTPWCKIEKHVVKDGDSALPIAQRKLKEAQKILTAINPREHVVCLDEGGKNLTSKQLATFLDTVGPACFIIGGAYGLDDTVKKACNSCLSLGSMTLPHELAHVVLLEQIYRAFTILHKIPYHHE